MNGADQDRLERAIDVIDLKAKALGLDFFETCFQIIDEELMAQLQAYILPVRFNHWSFGRDYERTKTKKRYGATALAYETVINTDPAYAFLMDSNNLTEMKLVVAHVFGHVDFFKNNYLYAGTNRGIVGDCAINARKIYDYSMRHGWETVERWLDACIAISPQCEMARTIRDGKDPWWQGGDVTTPDRPRSFDIQDEFDFLFEQDKMKRLAEWEEDQKKPKPILEKDLLRFLMHNRFSDLEDWQKDVLAIVRDEWQYFVPNIQTKVMNEGWSCVTGDSLVSTDIGFIPMCELAAYQPPCLLHNHNGLVSYAQPHSTSKQSIRRVTLHNGLSIKGLNRHRVQVMRDGKEVTVKLSDINIGDLVITSFGNDCWSSTPYALSDEPPSIYGGGRTAKSVVIPDHLNEDVAEYIGVFVAEGFYAKRALQITNTDRELLVKMGDHINNIFDVESVIKRRLGEESNKFDLITYSTSLMHLFENQLGVAHHKSRDKCVPSSILRSPKPIVCAFLRGLFEGDACVTTGTTRAIIYATASSDLASQVCMLLSNMGIHTTLTRSKKRGYQDGYRVNICSHKGLEFFKDEIGFISTIKNEKLDAILFSYKQHHHKKIKPPQFDKGNTHWVASPVISIDELEEELCYDLTVPDGHVYVGNGILNHNTYWHNRVLSELDIEQDFLTDEDGDNWFLFYNALNSNVQAPGSIGRINPYFVGNMIWKRIHDRWETPRGKDVTELGLPGGQGEEKMFEVRSTTNDPLFIRNFLDAEAVEELDLFAFERVGKDWVIRDTDPVVVRDALMQQMMGMQPIIYVIDDDHKDSRELLLVHEFNGKVLDEEHTRRTMAHLATLWKRPVHLRTTVRFTSEIGTNEKHNFAIDQKAAVRGEVIPATFTHDGVESSVMIHPGMEPQDPMRFSKNHLDAKWRSERFRERHHIKSIEDGIQ